METNEFASLHNLIPNFKNVTTGLITDINQDVYFQIKSFRCANHFYNLLPGDALQISTGIEWYNGNFTDIETTGDASNTPLSLVLHPSTETNGRTVTAPELVDLLNATMNEWMLANFLTTIPNNITYEEEELT